MRPEIIYTCYKYCDAQHEFLDLAINQHCQIRGKPAYHPAFIKRFKINPSWFQKEIIDTLYPYITELHFHSLRECHDRWILQLACSPNSTDEHILRTQRHPLMTMPRSYPRIWSILAS